MHDIFYRIKQYFTAKNDVRNNKQNVNDSLRGYELVYEAYKMAVKNGYMFGCYGDSLWNKIENIVKKYIIHHCMFKW